MLLTDVCITNQVTGIPLWSVGLSLVLMHQYVIQTREHQVMIGKHAGCGQYL